MDIFLHQEDTIRDVPTYSGLASTVMMMMVLWVGSISLDGKSINSTPIITVVKHTMRAVVLYKLSEIFIAHIRIHFRQIYSLWVDEFM